MREGMRRLRSFGLAIAMVLVSGVSAFAQTTECEDLETTPTVEGAIACVMETVQPFSVLVAILAAFVPILLVIWGLRGGFSLLARVISAMFAFITRRA